MAWSRPLTQPSLLQQAVVDQASIEASMENRALEDGSMLRMLDAGAGEAVVFVPMIAEMNFVYAPQMELLRHDYRVLAYEPRLSRTRHFSIEDRAREIALLLDDRELDDAHIVAWSDAGAAGYSFAKTWPGRCRSAVFLGLADEYRFPQPLQMAIQLLAVAPIERFLPDRVLARILAFYLGGKQVKRKWVMEKAAAIPRLAPLFKHSVLPNLLEHRPLAGELHVPTALVCGDNDALVTLGQAHRMARLLGKPGGATVVPGGEHFLGYVHPNPVNAAILEFYQTLITATARTDRTN